MKGDVQCAALRAVVAGSNNKALVSYKTVDKQRAWLATYVHVVVFCGIISVHTRIIYTYTVPGIPVDQCA